MTIVKWKREEIALKKEGDFTKGKEGSILNYKILLSLQSREGVA